MLRLLSSTSVIEDILIYGSADWRTTELSVTKAYKIEKEKMKKMYEYIHKT